MEMLAHIQMDFPKEYNEIKEFGSDPSAILELVNKLEPAKQAILLNVLLQAGNFGKRMSNIFDSNPEEQLKLAEDLRNFAKQLLKL